MSSRFLWLFYALPDPISSKKTAGALIAFHWPAIAHFHVASRDDQGLATNSKYPTLWFRVGKFTYILYAIEIESGEANDGFQKSKVYLSLHLATPRGPDPESLR